MKAKKLRIMTNIVLSTIVSQSIKAQEQTNKIKPDLIETLANNEISKENNTDIININHEKFIEQEFTKILEFYWESKWLSLINQHFLIELNILRDSAWLWQLKLDEDLSKAAQGQSEFLEIEWEIYHMQWENSQRKRLKNDWFNFTSCWENLASWQKNIKEIIDDWMASSWHKVNMLDKKYSDAWLWVSISDENKTFIVLYFIKKSIQ